MSNLVITFMYAQGQNLNDFFLQITFLIDDVFYFYIILFLLEFINKL